MFDPEDLYRDLVSGSSTTIRSQADRVDDAARKVNQAATRVREAADRPTWNSAASMGFAVRTAGVSHGINVSYYRIGKIEAALRASAKAYDAMDTNVTSVIKQWRNRPANLNPLVEQIAGLVYCMALWKVEAAYDDQLTAVEAFLTGIDTSKVDDDTRKWLSDGMGDTAEWLRKNGGVLGPMIPNLGVNGDKRGLIPQGLGYDPETGWIIQTSYSKDPEQPSTLSMVDPVTGKEVADVELGGWTGRDSEGDRVDLPTPDHAGGVASDGKYTYVTSSGDPSHVLTYRNSDIRRGGSEPIQPVGKPLQIPDGAGAYGTLGPDGALYVGTHTSDIGGGGSAYDGDDDDGRLYRYVPDGSGGWRPDDSFGGGAGYVHTPPQAQGVVVRDGEYVFSTSLGRDKPGRLIVQDRQDDQEGNGDRGEAYELPYMSEGIIELHGEIIATYESAADHYGPHSEDAPENPEDLWANPHMTRTTLAALGLSEDLDVSPESLVAAANDFDTAAQPLTRGADILGGVTISASSFGKVSAATSLSSVLTTELESSGSGLDDGATAVEQTAENLRGNARVYTGTDDSSARDIGRYGPTYSP